MRKIRTITVLATNIAESVMGLDLVDEVAASKLATARVHHLTDDTAIMMVDSIDSCYATDSDTVAELICTPGELIYVADSDRVENLSKYLGVGKSGLCAEDVTASDGYLRGFWSAPNTPDLAKRVIAFLKGEKPPEDKPAAPTCPDKGADDEAPAEDGKPAESLEELYHSTTPARPDNPGK